MLRTFFGSLLVLWSLSFTGVPAQAGHRGCGEDACDVLHRGHVRGRLPIACVSIPFIKEGYGKVAMFVLRDFNPHGSKAEILRQLNDDDNVVYRDSKVTGPIDDFCRGRQKFAGGNWVVICDEYRLGAITDYPLAYAIRNGRPPGNRRVRVGTHV